jgi:hypothetical protein
MSDYSSHSLGHFAEQLTCAEAQSKTVLDPSGSSGTRKMEDGVTELRQGVKRLVSVA